jgi:hypothetical protein
MLSAGESVDPDSPHAVRARKDIPTTTANRFIPAL